MANSRNAERIAILVGIPTTCREFHDRAADPLWDYGRKLLCNRSVDEAFDTLYKPVCAVAEDLLGRSAAGRVSIYQRAGLRDMVDASRKHDVIVVVAHWRGSLVTNADLLPGWATVLMHHARETPLALVANAVRSRTGGAPTDLTAYESDPDMRAIVVAALNHVVETGVLRRFLPHQLGTKITAHDLIFETLSRDLLDDAFNGALRRGNQLELADGLHSPADVDYAIDEVFSGLLDLSCCTSSVLGTYLKLTRGDRLRVLMGDHFIVPAPQLRLLERTLELLALTPHGKYIDARLTLSHGLRERFEAEQVLAHKGSDE